MAEKILQDTFTDADTTSLASHAMTRGRGWTVGKGSFAIATNKVATYTAATSDQNCWADAGMCDCIITCDLVLGSAATRIDGLFIRATDTNNGWYILLEADGGANTLYIFERSGGSNNVVASVADANATASSAVSLQVVVNLNTITATDLTNNVSVSWSSANSNRTATKYGLVAWTATTYTTGTYDNFVVSGLDRMSLPNKLRPAVFRPGLAR